MHEPKGVSTAPSGTVYVASGSGGGTWSRIRPTSLSGVNSDNLPNRSVVTDGAGGFTLVNERIFGSVVNQGPGWFTDSAVGITASGDALTTITSGYYEITGMYSGSSDNGDNPGFIEISLFRNGTESGNRFGPRPRWSDLGSATASTIVYLNSGDVIRVGISSNAGSTSFLSSSLSLNYLGA